MTEERPFSPEYKQFQELYKAQVELLIVAADNSKKLIDVLAKLTDPNEMDLALMKMLKLGKDAEKMAEQLCKNSLVNPTATAKKIIQKVL